MEKKFIYADNFNFSYGSQMKMLRISDLKSLPEFWATLQKFFCLFEL